MKDADAPVTTQETLMVPLLVDGKVIICVLTELIDVLLTVDPTVVTKITRIYFCNGISYSWTSAGWSNSNINDQINFFASKTKQYRRTATSDSRVIMYRLSRV